MSSRDQLQSESGRKLRAQKLAASADRPSAMTPASAVPLAVAAAGSGVIEALTGTAAGGAPASRLRRADEILSLTLKIVTVLALSFGLFEYDRQKGDARITESLKLVEQWESGGFRDAYGKVNDLVWPIFEAARQASPDLFEETKARARALANIGETVTGADNNFNADADRAVDKVFHFFERAALCADQQICDYGVLKTFLGSEAESFWIYFARYAERRRAAGYPTYGKWTEAFIEGRMSRVKFLGLL